MNKSSIYRHKALGWGWSIFRGMLLFGLCFVLLYPLLYMISVAFRPTKELYDPMVIWIPKTFVLDNIIDAYHAMSYPRAVLATIQLGGVSAALQVISCALVGYGFARFKFIGRDLLFSLVIFTIIVPPQIIIIPIDFFGIGKIVGWITGTPWQVNLLNTRWTFYLPAMLGTGLRSGLFIYMFRQFFRGLPQELEDAAHIDGCGPFETFIKVMVPNASGVFLTVGLFSMVWYWNDYFLSSMYFTRVNTVSVALAGLQNSLSLVGFDIQDPTTLITRMQAGSVLAVAPLLIIYIFLQRYFTESIERTGIVG